MKAPATQLAFELEATGDPTTEEDTVDFEVVEDDAEQDSKAPTVPDRQLPTLAETPPQKQSEELPPADHDRAKNAPANEPSEQPQRKPDLNRLPQIQEKARKIREHNEQFARRIKKTMEEDDDEAADRRKRWRNYAVLGIACVCIGALILNSALSTSANTNNQYPQLTPKKLVAEYAKDRSAADDKYLSKIVVVRGKVKVEPPLTELEKPRYFFETEGAADLRIEIQLSVKDGVVLKNGREYRILGKVKSVRDGNIIVLDEANRIAL
jgi:hypothetical protein